MDETTIKLIAARAALILADWLNVNPARKVDNGDRSSTGGMTMMFGLMTQQNEPPPPADIVQKMTDYLVGALSEHAAKRQHGIYFSLDCDYGPGRELAALSDACGIQTSWPWKTHMTIRAFPGSGIMVSSSQGHQAPHINHHFVDNVGWVVSECSIDPKLMPTILAAITGGTLASEVARLDTFEPVAAAA